MYYFYVLKSEADSKFYYGSTNDLKRRIREHDSAKVASTAYRIPINLVYYEAYTSLDLARMREKQVKSSGSVRTSLLKRIAMHP